ncbi:MAG: hypothetical protein ACYC2G_01270 [Gemmatimonadaceae bacterium]
MRIVLPFLLLFGFMSLDARAQAPVATAQPSAQLPAEVPAEVPAEARVPAQSTPAAAPQAAPPGEPASAQQPAHAEAATDAGQAQPEEPKQRSRAIWFLLGAVVVLGVVLAASM